jgi:hypothetical protein
MVGPASTLPVPRIGSLADGMVTMGPRPQIRAPGCAGDRYSSSLTSPMLPFVLLATSGLGWLTTGTMEREIRFHCEFKCIGTTGSMLSMSCVRLNGPTWKLVLFWNGTLTRSRSGFVMPWLGLRWTHLKSLLKSSTRRP